MTVSIITVVRNARADLERTMESVAHQTYPDIEYVVVDGASTDGTLELIKQSVHSINLWISEPDKSLYDAMNKGLHLATGDFVWFLNAGDTIPQTDTLALAMANYNDEDLIYGKVLLFEEDGSLGQWHKPHPKVGSLAAKHFINGMIICHQAMIVRRALAAEYNLSYRLAGDIDWAIRTMKKVKKTRDTQLALCCFQRGGISSKQKKASLKERFHILHEHFGLAATLWQHLIFIKDKIFRR
ncbi:MAG: glycosyltransferase [Bernardetiaceae bacterium]|nr:glycosyltransferase [Bernardetiaceae bacterium]